VSDHELPGNWTAKDIFPDGTIIHRRMTIIGETVHVAYIKSRGEWFMTAGHPILWEDLASTPSYPIANHYDLRLPEVH
jgi:hypothetical protein